MLKSENCIICMDIIHREFKMAKCGHRFCLLCGITWAIDNPKCALCKVPSDTFFVYDPCNTQFSSSSPFTITPQTTIQKENLLVNTKDKSTRNLNDADEKSIKSNSVLLKTVEPKEMDLKQILKEYYLELQANKIYKADNNKICKLMVEDEVENLDISIFSENIKALDSQTKIAKRKLNVFRNYMFYHDFINILKDIDFMNEMYLKGIRDRLHLSSNKNLATYIEIAFEFIKYLTEKLQENDWEAFEDILTWVDHDLYLKAKVQYNFRKDEYYEDDYYNDDYYEDRNEEEP